MGGVALYHADYTPDAMVPMAAASRDQTGILLNQAAGFIRRTPGLDRRFRVYEGYRRIDALRTGGRIQVYAADDRTGDGVIFTLALLEELHRHPDLRLYRTWHGKIEKRGGQLVAISTAGEPGGEYENVKAGDPQARRVRRRGAHTVARTKDLVLHQHALAPGDDVHDLKRVKQANPFSGVTIAGLRRKHDSPTMLESHWARFVCGIPTRGEAAAITAAEWAA
jgi:phage terminase large subunit-like protein